MKKLATELLKLAKELVSAEIPDIVHIIDVSGNIYTKRRMSTSTFSTFMGRNYQIWVETRIGSLIKSMDVKTNFALHELNFVPATSDARGNSQASHYDFKGKLMIELKLKSDALEALNSLNFVSSAI